MILSIFWFVPARGEGISDPRFEGLRLYETGRFAEAISHFDQVLKRHPHDSEILNKRGICYLRTEQPLMALADFDRVTATSQGFGKRFDPGFFSAQSGVPQVPARMDFAETWGNRGIALLMLGREQDALQSFQQAVSLWTRLENRPGAVAPRNRARLIRSRAGAYEGLGQALHRTGQNASAAEAYSSAIAIDSTDPNAFAGRGDVLAAARLVDQAIADYTEAIRLDPSHSRALAGRGIVRFEQGQDELALADLDRAIALDQKYAKAYSFRGATFARRGANERALADYDAVIALLPDNAGAYKDKGGVLVRLGRFAEAIKALDDAIRLDPRRATAFQNRGAAYSGSGQYERAIDDFTEAIRLDPENAGAYSNRGLAHFAIGEYDQAVADLSRAIQIAPGLAIVHFNRGAAFDRLGLQSRALDDYGAATRLDPRLGPAYAAIGRIKSQTGQRDAAIDSFDMALRLDPNEGPIYLDRANARRESGDWLGALADYDRVVAVDPKRAEAYLARGWTRLAAGAEWADNDARAYLALRGWRDPVSPYMAVLAILGARGTEREAAARRLLDEAIASASPAAWPAPLLRYFKGHVSEEGLFVAASGVRQQIEAHTFVGLDRLRAGDRQAALRHLRFARDFGLPRSIATDLSRATLRRID
jgi:tetratricopeptide (TPR) repeat protein